MSYQIAELRKISSRTEYGKFVFLVPENMGTPLGSFLRSLALCEFLSFGVTLISFPMSEYQRFSGLQESLHECIFSLKNIVFQLKNQTNVPKMEEGDGGALHQSGGNHPSPTQTQKARKRRSWSFEKMCSPQPAERPESGREANWKNKKNYFQLYLHCRGVLRFDKEVVLSTTVEERKQGESLISSRALYGLARDRSDDLSAETEDLSAETEENVKENKKFLSSLHESGEILRTFGGKVIAENTFGVVREQNVGVLFLESYKTFYTKDICYPDGIQPLDTEQKICSTTDLETDFVRSSHNSKMILFNFGYEKKSSQTPRRDSEAFSPEFFSFPCSPPPAIQKINFTLKKNIQNFEGIYFEIFTNGSVSPAFVFEWMKKKAIFEMQNSMQNHIFTSTNRTSTQ